MAHTMKWFAVRTIFRHEVLGSEATFEEKIILYLAKDLDAAMVRAQSDVSNYAAMNKDFVPLKHYGVFEIGHGEQDLDGKEVWSHMSQGPVDSEQFYRERHARFEIRDLPE
jgi:hypothetical protein